MTAVDRQKLLDHLENRIQTYGGLIAIAVVDGLKTAVERGDFDTEQEETK